MPVGAPLRSRYGTETRHRVPRTPRGSGPSEQRGDLWQPNVLPTAPRGGYVCLPTIKYTNGIEFLFSKWSATQVLSIRGVWPLVHLWRRVVVSERTHWSPPRGVRRSPSATAGAL